MAQVLSAAEYRLLVENSPVMTWRAGLDAECNYFNDTWLAFTGRTLEQESGSGWAQGVHPEDLDRCIAFYLDHFQRHAAFEMEYRLRRHDGVYRWIFDRGVPCHDDAGRFVGFIGSCVDVDERRRADDLRKQHGEEQLALARDFEKWMLAIVSHDIRNPLGSIQFAAHHLLEAADDAGAVKKSAGIVKRAVERINRIVGDLLDLSRERDGSGIPIVPQAVDMRPICQQIIDELAAMAGDREITFDREGDGAGIWDEHRILQAVSNLASNAVQHGTPGSPVQLRITGDAELVVVEVRNEGAIPPDLLPRIFEPFRSGRHRTSRDGGLGLGLFIANAIARAHGGTVEVESLDATTTFRLVLPRRPAVRPAAEEC